MVTAKHWSSTPDLPEVTERRKLFMSVRTHCLWPANDIDLRGVLIKSWSDCPDGRLGQVRALRYITRSVHRTWGWPAAWLNGRYWVTGRGPAIWPPPNFGLFCRCPARNSSEGPEGRSLRKGPSFGGRNAISSEGPCVKFARNCRAVSINSSDKPVRQSLGLGLSNQQSITSGFRLPNSPDLVRPNTCRTALSDEVTNKLAVWFPRLRWSLVLSKNPSTRAHYINTNWLDFLSSLLNILCATFRAFLNL
jgi:hypothetical protein